LADWLAVAVAVALPWSTSAVGIAIAAWLIVFLPTLDGAYMVSRLYRHVVGRCQLARAPCRP
jgi:hypothetical protein